MKIEERIRAFLSAPAFGVVGASADRRKYGNKVLRCYLQNGRNAFPVNPRERLIEGVSCVPDVAALPEGVGSISIITPPRITEGVVEEVVARGLRNVWMQPGAESERAVARCRESGVNVIADGSCVLVVLGYQESWVPG
jgi:predicted CoA-binding protein